jgi:signal transduction histidine kinase
VVFLLAAVVFAAAGIGTIIYMVSIQTPDGQITTSAWPKNFTDQFSNYVSVTDGKPFIEPYGLKLIRQYELWFQLLNKDGGVIQSLGRTEGKAARYTAADLLHMNGSTQGSEKETIYLGSCREGGAEWYYIIGFPVKISTVTTYMNGDRFTSGRAVLTVLLVCGFLLLILAGFAYGLWITRQMRKVTRAVESIAARAYLPEDGRGFLKDIYRRLNLMDHEIRVSDETKADTDRQREEWIANMTHDIRTPLSPIKGYAELLADTYDEVDADKTRAYAQTILKNANRAERLVNDLKLIYQMKGGIMPVHMERTNVTRFVKEAVIDLLNTPEYDGRDIRFESGCDHAYALLDEPLMVRALNNIIINAIVHNPPDTIITVSVGSADGIEIRVHDTGKGLEGEAERLFDRYYRGSGAGEKPEGSGLGLHIAKQIVILHNGVIKAQSALGQGTEIMIILPKSEN